jgi:hypothetical protein
MDDSDRELNDLSHDDLPGAIVARLRRADGSQPIVDPRTDRAVLDEARSYFAARPQRAAARRARWALPLGAAAAVLAGWLVVGPFGSMRVPSPDDVDGSGRVDVLDVLALARASAARGDTADPRVDELAARIVSLGAPRSRP